MEQSVIGDTNIILLHGRRDIGTRTDNVSRRHVMWLAHMRTVYFELYTNALLIIIIIIIIIISNRTAAVHEKRTHFRRSGCVDSAHYSRNVPKHRHGRTGSSIDQTGPDCRT